MPTVYKYIESIGNIEGFTTSYVTGSYHDPDKNDFGDIDIVIFIDDPNAKKLFREYVDNMSGGCLVEFPGGKRKGSKSQMFGDVVTVCMPIVGQPGEFVQIDNIISTSIEEYNFKKHFYDLPAPKQVLLTALTRVLKDGDKYEMIHQFYKSLPKLKENQEFEFVLSSKGLSLRIVTLSDEMKETDRTEIWRTNNWTKVQYLLRNWDFEKLSYEELIDIASVNFSDDSRACRRILGIMKSMINIGPGEMNTPKGQAKQAAIDYAINMLEQYTK